MSLETHKSLCGGRKIENLIKSMCFHLRISRVHVFCLDFSRVCMFCDGNNSKLVIESTQPGGFQT